MAIPYRLEMRVGVALFRQVGGGFEEWHATALSTLRL